MYALVKHKRYRYHLPDIASNFPVATRPLLAFDPERFLPEMEMILNLMFENSKISPIDSLQYTKKFFLGQNMPSEELITAAQYFIVRNYTPSSNGDEIWKENSGFTELIHSQEIGYFLRWLLSRRIHLVNHFMDNFLSPFNLTRSTLMDPAFLFTEMTPKYVTVDVSKNENGDSIQDSSRTDELVGLSENLAELTNTLQKARRTQQKLLESTDPYSRKRRSRRSVDKETKAVENTETEVDQAEIDNIQKEVNELLSLPLPEFIRSVANNIHGEEIKISSGIQGSWVVPPILTLSTFYDLLSLEKQEASFLLQLYAEVNNLQICLNIIYYHFYRLKSLWSTSISPIAPALYSQEMKAIFIDIEQTVPFLSSCFLGRFLLMESFVPPQEFFAQDTKKALLHIEDSVEGRLIDIESFLDSSLNVFSNCILVVDRLRISFLYGPNHPSFVGRDFLTSLLYRYHLYRHTALSFETMMEMNTVRYATSLPRNTSLMLEDVSDTLRFIHEGAQERNVVEPDRERIFLECFKDENGNIHKQYRSTLSATETIEPFYPIGKMGAELYCLLEKMWELPSYITREIDLSTLNQISESPET